MRLLTDAKGFAVEANAIKTLKTKLEMIGRTLEDTRWLIAVNEKKKFVPVVCPTPTELPGMIILAHHGIGVVA